MTKRPISRSTCSRVKGELASSMPIYNRPVKIVEAISIMMFHAGLHHSAQAAEPAGVPPLWMLRPISVIGSLAGLCAPSVCFIAMTWAAICMPASRFAWMAPAAGVGTWMFLPKRPLRMKVLPTIPVWYSICVKQTSFAECLLGGSTCLMPC